MSQLLSALIEHNLSPEEIINLPNRLKSCSEDIISPNWQWRKENLVIEDITHYWLLDAEYFINNAWNESDLLVLANDDLDLHFFSPTLIVLGSFLRWASYDCNEPQYKRFNKQVNLLAPFLDAKDALLVPDLSSVDFFDETIDTTVDAYRQKAAGNLLYAKEL